MTFGPRKDAEAQYCEWSKALDIFVTMITDLEKHCSSSLLSTALKQLVLTLSSSGKTVMSGSKYWQEMAGGERGGG